MGKSKETTKKYYENKYDGLREVGRWTALTNKFSTYLYSRDNHLTSEEFKLLFYLISTLEFNSNNLIEIKQKDIATALYKHKTSISKGIKKLKDLNIIAKKDKKIYMFNPRFVFINGTNDIHKYLKEYEEIENNKFEKEREKQQELIQKAKQNSIIKQKAESWGITDPKQIQKLINLEVTADLIDDILSTAIIKNNR